MTDKNAIVIFRISDGKPSGVVRYIDVLKKCILAFSEYDILVVQFDINGKFHNEYYEESGRVTLINFPFLGMSNPLNMEKSRLELHHDYLEMLILPYVKKYKRVVFHVQEMCLMELAVHLKQKLNCKIIFHQHVLPWKFIYQNDETRFNKIFHEYEKGEYSGILENKLEAYSYRNADIIIPVTEMAKDYINRVFGIEASKIKVIYNGIFDCLPSLGLKREEKGLSTLLFVGRVSKEKGIYDLLETLLHIPKSIRYRLLIVGEYDNEFVEMINSRYSNVNIELAGMIAFDKLKAIYLKRPIGVIPSIHEQCSYTAIEMSMFGLPVIYSSVDGLKEIFTDGVNGLKIDLGFNELMGVNRDIKKFSNSILKMLSDKESRYKYGDEARKNYCKNFTAQTMFKKLNKIYASCLK